MRNKEIGDGEIRKSKIRKREKLNQAPGVARKRRRGRRLNHARCKPSSPEVSTPRTKRLGGARKITR